MNMDHLLELETAIEEDDREKVKRLIRPEDLTFCDEFSGTLLHYAARLGSLEMVEFLVEQGMNVSQRGGSWNCPALTYAAENGKSDIVRYLVEAGSVIDTSFVMANPLLRAASRGHYDIVEFLLTTNIDRHASYPIPTGAVVNALVEAQMCGHKRVAELLKAHGCHLPIEGVDYSAEAVAETSVPKRPKANSTHDEVVVYMEERFGSVEASCVQELVPIMDGFSISVHVIEPNEEHPYLVFFTNGMSSRPMNVPAGQEQWRYAELAIHLPPEWLPPHEAHGDPQWLWPAQWLRKMAYVPHLDNSWLGRPAAIVSSDEPPVPLGPNTEQTCLLLFPDFANLDPPLARSDGSMVHFYTVVPLFTEERDFERQHGMKAFFKKFVEHKVPMTVDLSRRSFA